MRQKQSVISMKFLWPVLCLLITWNPACAEDPLRINGETMGSYYSIVIDSPGSTDGERLQKDIEEIFAEINRQMSNWSKDSEITRFNESQSTDWFPVGKQFAIVTQEAKRLHTVTGGKLDVTVAPLIELWGFGRNKVKRVPTEEQLKAAMESVGMQHVEVQLDPPAIRKLKPEININLAALAPGFAADEVSKLLRERGLKAHVVDVGGENLAGEAKASGDPWRLGVESPLGGLHKVVELTNKAIATSGDYRNFFVIDGRRYSHILDPSTGKPVENPPASVSVIHKSCMTADALGTAMMVLGPEEGLKLAKSLNVDVLFLDVTKEGRLEERSTGVFAETE